MLLCFIFPANEALNAYDMYCSVVYRFSSVLDEWRWRRTLKKSNPFESVRRTCNATISNRFWRMPSWAFVSADPTTPSPFSGTTSISWTGWGHRSEFPISTPLTLIRPLLPCHRSHYPSGNSYLSHEGHCCATWPPKTPCQWLTSQGLDRTWVPGWPYLSHLVQGGRGPHNT